MDYHLRAYGCPVVNPLGIVIGNSNAAMRTVDIAKVTSGAPVITVNGIITVKIINKRDIWLEIGASVCVKTAHVLAANL